MSRRDFKGFQVSDGNSHQGRILRAPLGITLSQVYEAIQYYFVHQAEIDKEREENTEEAGRRMLLEKLAKKKYKEITGG